MVRRAFFWSFSSQIVNFAVQFGTSVVMARLLSPAELGVYGVAWSVIGIVQLFTGFSVASYVIRESELTSQTLDTAFTINTVLSLALAFLIFLASFVATPFLGNVMVGEVMRLLALTPVIGIVAFRPTAMLQRAMQLRGVSIVGSIGAVVGSATGIATAKLGYSSLSPAYGAIATAVVTSIGSIAIGRSHHSLRMSTRNWRPITAFGLRLMSIGGVSITASRVSDIILARLLGLSALGLFNRANNLNYLLFTNVYGAATRVVFAKLSEAQRDQDRVTEVFEHGFRLIVAVMGPMLLGLAVLARPMIYLLYGERWLGAALPLSLLLIGQFIALGFAMNWELFVVRDDLKTQTRLEGFRSAMTIVTRTIGCLIGLTAVAAAAIVDSIASLFLYRKHMVRLTRAPLSRLNRLYVEALAISAVAILPSAILMINNAWDERVPMPLVISSIGLGIGLWAVLVWWLDHPLLAEIELMRGKLRSAPSS